MTVTYNLDDSKKLTESQIKDLELAKTKPIQYDEDSPKMTDAMKKAFILAAKTRNRHLHIS